MKSDEQPLGLVMVIDDDDRLSELISRWIRAAGYEVERRADGESGLSALTSVLPDVALLDLGLPGADGLEVLRQIRAHHPLLPVVILTADDGVGSVVAAMRGGAWDYLAKPIDRTKLVTTLRNAVERSRMSLRLAHLEREVRGAGHAGMVGSSPAMKALFRQIDRLAASDITVLVHGESGTGKELIASAIHQGGGRRAGPFIAVNCAAVPETLQESELFGHEKGAFTGAAARHTGRFEQAHGGTLFLDEVAELSLSAQAKLLRVLQERRFHRVGGTTELSSDFRLVAATHRDLSQFAREGGFREDLYFRIAVFELEVPPLRAREDDVLALAQAFLDRRAQKDGSTRRLSDAARRAITEYHWPGNVRELQNAIERASVVADGELIEPEDLPARVRRGRVSEPAASATPAASAAVVVEKERRPEAEPPLRGQPAPLPDDQGLTLEDLERRAIEEALRRTNGSLVKAVQHLGIGRTTLYRKIKKYGLGH